MANMVAKQSVFPMLGVLGLALALSGCAQGLEGLVDSQERDSFLVTGSVNATSQATALAALPREAGRVLSVREQRRADGVQQHVVLSGDALAAGENWIKVDVAAHRVPAAPSQVQLHTEMQYAFEGQALPIHNYLIRNAHGPVGLAFGTAGALGPCAYIWQETEQNAVQATDRQIFARASGTWSVRARLCRERLTLDHAVAFAQGLSLGAFSDPLYAPLASATVATAPGTGMPNAPASALASLDGEPRQVAPASRRARTTPPRPSPVGPAAAVQSSPTPAAVTITPPGVPDVRQPPLPSQETAIAIPLPD